jgi:type VI secretion system protein ImpF
MDLDKDQPLVLSLLDRLIDTHPELSRDPPFGRGQHLAVLRASIRRDLEELLNTRRRCIGWPDELRELDQSMVGYGIPDFTGSNMASENEQNAFLLDLERAIARFEPRFKFVEVSRLPNPDEFDRTLRFRIYAEMYAEPAPEPMMFESILDPLSRNFSVASTENA